MPGWSGYPERRGFMLKMLRKHTSSWMLRAILILVAVTFISWGGYSLIREKKETYAAKVKLLEEAAAGGWIIAWGHDPDEPLSRIEKKDDNYIALGVRTS